MNIIKHLPGLFLALALPLGASPLSGTKSIGPGGDYASLAAAVADINVQTVGGPLVLELQSNYSLEALPLAIPALAGASATNPVTIRPAGTVTAPIVFTSADTTSASVDLNGAQFVTFDGRPGGVGTAKQLTIANTSISGVAVRFINEASGNALRFLTLQGVNTSASSGTVVFGTTTGANGNDDNILDTCDLRDGASTPANALYSLGSNGTSAQNNSGNTVSNCNVFNFYRNTAADASGVRLDGGNTDWTIIGNSFYQTASRGAVAASVRAIHINNTSGNNFTVTGNFIGGRAAGAGGTAWTTTGTAQSYSFEGIRLNVGTTTASSVQGNTIRNIVWTGSSSAPFTGIFVQAGNSNVGTDTGNTIGSGTGTGSISITSYGATAGIRSASGGTVAISNNAIGSINVTSTAGSSTGDIPTLLVGIQVTAGANAIANNTVGSTTTSNSLNAGITTATQTIKGIFSSSPASTLITGNTLANLNNSYISANNDPLFANDTIGQILGIEASDGVNTITDNTVRNLSTSSGTISGSTTAAMLGISQSSTAAGQTVSQNVVHSLAITAGGSNASVVGIYYKGNTTTGPNLIANNLVHSLASASTAQYPELRGIRFDSGTFTAWNNMVRVGLDASGVGTARTAFIYGILDNGATAGRNFYHNSVHVGGTQTSGSNVTYAFASNGTGNSRDFRNNIFVNARTRTGGSSKHYAVQYGGTGANPAELTANKNIFFVSGTGGVLGIYGGVDKTTLAAWNAVTGQDALSDVVDPQFLNPTGTAETGDLHLQASNPAEGAGEPITSVTDDFDGETRSSLTPVDIGADAGLFTDNRAPAISYPLLSDGTVANRTVTGWASITDNSGIISSGENAPRLYYKKSTDADAFPGNTSADDGWKYVTGTDGGSGYGFTVDYSLIHGGGVNVGDTIQYFVVAQDTADNFTSGPIGATASANPPVQNISVKPSGGVNSYNILPTVNGGTVTVGPGGTCPNFSGGFGLFATLNISTLTSNLTVDVIGDTTEDGSTALNAFTAPYTVTIQPDSAAMRTISGSVASGLIRLSGARRLTIDGSSGGSGRYLTFRNTSTAGATVLFVNDASDNTLRNCVFEGRTSSLGVVTFSTGVTTGNDNNTVTGNRIRDRSDAFGVPVYLVYSAGTSETIANSANTISSNELLNFTSVGIYEGSGSDSWSITGNTIYQTAARGSQLFGIYLGGLGTNTIRGNAVRDLMTSNYAYGIYLGYMGPETVVEGNRIWNLGNAGGSTIAVHGIFFQPIGGQNVTVTNNMIALGTPINIARRIYGIRDSGVPGSTTVTAHNTVLITGDDGGSNWATWAFNRTGGSNATAKNNVFLNLRTGGGNHFAANRDPADTGSLTMDYNVYAGTGATTAANFFDSSNGYDNTGNPVSYAQWQAIVPTDTHSSAGNPGGNYTSAKFVAPATANLHLIPGGNPLMNNAGTPLSGVATDFDEETRDSTTPDIGADESDGINTVPTITAQTGVTFQLGSPPSHVTIATVGDTESGAGGVAVSITGANPSNGVTVSNIANNNGTITADVVAVSGATDATFTLQASDGNLMANATLNVTVTPDTPPTLAYDNPTAITTGYFTTIYPTSVPGDNGTIITIALQSAGTYTGTISVDQAGVVSISDAAPVGTHTITIRATDNSGLFTDATFVLTVNAPPPNLSINDVTQNEGDAGTSTFTFTVSLDSPAPASGVTFNISTYDTWWLNTASRFNDYVEKELTGQTIPEGSSTYSFDVLVNGDEEIEASETFFVDVWDVNGATPVDSEGLGTITNDDLLPVTVAGSTGADGDYSTMWEAFAAINAQPTQTGNVITVGIRENTNEGGAVAELNAPSGGSWSSLTVAPTGTGMRTIFGSAADSLIRLNGADGVTIDGSFGGSGRHLTFRNTNANGATLAFVNDASDNIVRNCVIEGGAGFGSTVVFFGTGVAAGNDNNTVTGNRIRGLGGENGLPTAVVSSSGSPSAAANSGNTVSNNELLDFAFAGVSVNSGSDSWSITGNTIYQTGGGTSYLCGIYFNGLGTNTIRGNIVRDLTTGSSATGILVGNEAGDTTVADNRLWNLGNTADSTVSAYGIVFSPDAGQSVTVVNNMIVLGSSGTTAQNLYGIRDQGAAGSTTVTAFNTVLLTGVGGAGADTWAFNRPGVSTATVLNNIFLNLRTGGSNHFAANRYSGDSGLLTIDYNVYAGTGLAFAAEFFDLSPGNGNTGTAYSYPTWQLNVPTDTHSSASTPGGDYTSAMFVDAANGDLHLVPGGNALVNNTGTPVAGVTEDFDGYTRNATLPYVGADEQPTTAAPTDITLSQDSIAENNAFGDTVGTLTASDTDAGDTHTFSLVAGTGDTDNDSFTIEGTALKLTSAADYEAKNSYDLRLRATDSGGLFFEKEFTIMIADLPETPVEIWRPQNFVSFANAGDAANTANPDGDPYNNLLEFAFGTDPNSPLSGPQYIALSGAEITRRGQPAILITNTVSGMEYHAIFGLRKDWLAAGLSYAVQFSNTMDTWETSNAGFTGIASDAEIDAVTVPMFLNNGEKARFFRVKVTIQ